MRLSNLTAATALAIASCIDIVLSADAAAEQYEVKNQHQLKLESTSNVDFTTENKITNCEVLKLVCDNTVIDTLYVCNRPIIVFGAGLVASNNNKPCSAKQCSNIISTVYIDMDNPCYKSPPNYAAVSADASTECVEIHTDSENENEGALDTNLNNDQSNDGLLLDKHNKHDMLYQHHRHKGGYHHRNHGHKGGQQRHSGEHHRHRNQLEGKHPWVGRCVSIGDFCGNRLFGYNFAANAFYKCDRIGAPPMFISACVGGCNSGACIIPPTTVTVPPELTSPTTTSNCIALITPVKDLVRNVLVAIENLPLGPEDSQLLKVALGTNLTAYFDNGVDSAGSIAAVLAITLPQIVDVIKTVQPSLGITDCALHALYGLVDQITKASSDLAACTGAKPDCTGLVVLSGYAIKIGIPILRAYLTFKFPPAAVAFILLQPTIDKISDGLIQVDDKGLTDLLAFIVDLTTGIVGSILPAPLNAILDIIKPILSIINDCPKS
ncbi:hypothetical protein BG003_006753 [Podila horticola]|nr:hypothetical protein BG003_006753 [Podila horticola]